MKHLGNRPVAAGIGLVLAGSLAAAGCASPGEPAGQAKPASQSRPASLSSLTRPAGTCTQAASAPVLASSLSHRGPAPGWTLPGANVQNTRDVASPINSANVSRLGVAWTVPISSAASAAGAAGDYAATPVVVHGVVYTQDLDSNVMAISLATGKVLWTHDYNSPNGGPDGVNVVGGTVYAATDSAAVALQASTGQQLWSRTLITSGQQGIDMAPGYSRGTVYVSTVPVNVHNSNYNGGGKADSVGAGRQDRSAQVELGRGPEPLGQPGPQLRRRPVGPALVRPAGQPVHRRLEPRPAGRLPPATRGAPAGPGPTCTPTRS